jgi:hypothetical protein
MAPTSATARSTASTKELPSVFGLLARPERVHELRRRAGQRNGAVRLAGPARRGLRFARLQRWQPRLLRLHARHERMSRLRRRRREPGRGLRRRIPGGDLRDPRLRERHARLWLGLPLRHLGLRGRRPAALQFDGVDDVVDCGPLGLDLPSSTAPSPGSSPTGRWTKGPGKRRPRSSPARLACLARPPRQTLATPCGAPTLRSKAEERQAGYFSPPTAAAAAAAAAEPRRGRRR